MADKKEEVKSKEKPKREVRAVKLILKEKPPKKEGKEKPEEDMLFVPEIIIYNHDTERNETYGDCLNYCHRDFVKSVLSLRDHFAILLTFHTVEEFETGEIDPKKFKARGFSISGNEDETRACLKGHFLTDLAGAIAANVNNIYIEKDMDADGGYDLIDDLKAKLDRIKLEAIAYLFEKKQMEDPQLSMKFPEGDKVTKAQVAAPATPEDIVKDIVDTANKGGIVDPFASMTPAQRKKAEKAAAANGQGDGRKQPQTPDNKTGAPAK